MNSETYSIPVGSKKEYRKIKFLLNAIGQNDIEAWSEGELGFSVLNRREDGSWYLGWSPIGLSPLSISDILDDLIKVLPRPAKPGSVNNLSPDDAEQVMSKMATEEEPTKVLGKTSVYGFAESAVRVKTKDQLVDVLEFLGVNSDHARAIATSVAGTSGFDDVCVDIHSGRAQVLDPFGKDTLHLGSQDIFRWKEYYIMEYNNFKRKTEKM